jgi:hypothetical protein
LTLIVLASTEAENNSPKVRTSEARNNDFFIVILIESLAPLYTPFRGKQVKGIGL